MVLLWLDQFWDYDADDPQVRSLARRQLYVAMTRAQDELHLVAGGRASLVADMSRSEVVNVAMKNAKILR